MIRYLPVFLIKSRMRSLQIILLILLYILIGLPIATAVIGVGSRIAVPFLHREVLISILLILQAVIFQVYRRFLLIKSDVDFLLSFGISNTRLALGFAVYALFLLSLPSLIILSMAGILTAHYAPLDAVIVFYLAIMFSSLGLFILTVFSRNTRSRVFLITFFALSLVGIARIPIGFGSISSIYWPYALATVLIYSAALFLQTVFALRSPPVSVHRRFSTGSSIVKNPIAFEKWSAKFPLLRFQSLYSFMFLRSRFMGKARPTGLKSSNVFFVEATAIVVLYVLVKIFPQFSYDFILLMFTIFLYILLLGTILASYSIIHERVWISFGSTDPSSASRQYIIGRLFYVTILSLPLLALVSLSPILGKSSPIYPLPSFIFLSIALFYPFFVFSLILSLNVIKMQFKLSYLNFNQQINIIYIPLFIAYVALLIVGVIFPSIGIITTIMCYIAAALLLMSHRIMQKTFFSLSYHGYM